VITLTIETAADLMVGDFLHRDGDELLVTKLTPATPAEARAYGEREVMSGTWRRTYDAAEPVVATPGRLRLARLAEQDGAA
jgi:hypothetical protein